MMFTRLLTKPNQSSFLLGPRGTGKSTWIRQNFEGVTTYDLLTVSEQLRLSRNPSILANELGGLPEKSWVVIDEVQKVPELLDEVHKLIEEKKLRFLLCGSSARKLKRSGVNLLAGRATMLHMFPLVSAEVSKKLDLNRTLQYGMLPMAYTGENPMDYLQTYANTYLQEEIRQEALVRNIGSFSRFLEIAARQNGQVTNFSNIAREAQIARQTVTTSFDILVETLIGSWLPAWKLKQSTKQISHSKFYFFDAGVARTLSGRLPYNPSPEESGILLETFLLQEIRAYLSYTKKNYQLSFWRNYNGNEVDFFLETQNGYVAIEVKSATEWQSKFHKGLRTLANEMGAKKVQQYGVYTGRRSATFGQTTVLPVHEFLSMLWNDSLIQ